MEWWNAGIMGTMGMRSGKISILILITFLLTQYSKIPVFHYSICERSELTCVSTFQYEIRIAKDFLCGLSRDFHFAQQFSVKAHEAPDGRMFNRVTV
jgi:hypothetical protein